MALLLGKANCDSIESSLDNKIDALTKRDIVSSISMFRDVYNKLDLWANETNIGTNTKKELETIINGIVALNELTIRLSETTREDVDDERKLWQSSDRWNNMPRDGVHGSFYDRDNIPKWKM